MARTKLTESLIAAAVIIAIAGLVVAATALVH
jgi:hypothetical protein